MNNRELILKSVNRNEDKLFVAKMLDKAYKAEKTGSITYSDFIDPYQKMLVNKVLLNNINTKHLLYGGYDGAERVIVIFCPDFIECNDFSNFNKLFKLIEATANGGNLPTHRDYLGALTGLGIKREKIGDILVDGNKSNIIVLRDIADFIELNLTKVGNTSVNVEVKDVDELETSEPKTKEIKATVASLRVDCIVSAGFGMSRAKIIEYIKAERLNLNWEQVSSPSKQIKEGDVISVRGRGRIIVESITGLTKKGRIGVLIKRLI